MRRIKWKVLGMNFLVLFVTLLFLFFILEAASRFLHLSDINKVVFNKYVGWTLEPETEFRRVAREYNVLIKTNSLGYRDDEYKTEKPDNTYRIVVLGDSFVVAQQVDFEKTSHQLLEKKLNSLNDGRNYEVINLGMLGYGTDNSYVTLKHYGLQYDPDLVILAFFTGNDVRNNHPKLGYDEAKPLFKLVNETLVQKKFKKPKKRLKDWLSRSAFVQFAATKIFNNHFLAKLFVKLGFLNKEVLINKGSVIPIDYYIYDVDYDEPWKEAWDITKHLILAIKNTAIENDADFLLVSLTNSQQVHPKDWHLTLEDYPAMKQLTWDINKPDDILSNFAKENRVDYLQLLPYFQKYHERSGKRLHGLIDAHWNGLGNKLAAELIFQKINGSILN